MLAYVCNPSTQQPKGVKNLRPRKKKKNLRPAFLKFEDNLGYMRLYLKTNQVCMNKGSPNSERALGCRFCLSSEHQYDLKSFSLV